MSWTEPTTRRRLKAPATEDIMRINEFTEFINPAAQQSGCLHRSARDWN